MKKISVNQFSKLIENYYKRIKNNELFFYSTRAKKMRSQLIGHLNEIDDDVNNILGENRLIEINSNSHISTLNSALSEDYKKAVYCLTILLNRLEKYSQTVKNNKASQIEIIKLIEGGENRFLELKSSLMTDYENKERKNIELEKVILKSISAFANSEGGTLLIGVRDNGEILGLEKDYLYLSGTKDKFELHLRNLIIQNFGGNFSASNINIEFVAFGNKEICKIDILKSSKPLYLTEKIDDGRGNLIKTDKFYVRDGNSSRELGIREIGEYWKKRFD